MVVSYYLLIILFQVSNIWTLQQIHFTAWFLLSSASVISTTLTSPISRWFPDSLQFLTNFCIQAITRVHFKHFEYFFRSNTQTFAVNVVASVTTWFDCNLSSLRLIFSSATSSSFICNHSFIDFYKNGGPLNHKSLEARTPTAVGLLTSSAGFIFVGTGFHIIRLVIDWILLILLATNHLNLLLLSRIHQSTFILSRQNVTTSILRWNALTSFLANLNPSRALSSSNLGILVACSGATWLWHEQICWNLARFVNGS